MGKITLTPLPKEKSPIIKLNKGGSIKILQKIETIEESQISVSDLLWETAEKENCNLFGIIDSAKNDEAFRFMIEGGVSYKSLFDGTMDVQSYGVSGFLVECRNDSPLFQWMTGKAWGDNCCIFFTSKASFDELFIHFQKFNRVYLEGDDVVLFRYYDPRVFRNYLPTCNGKEIDLFFGEIKSFFAERKNPGSINIFGKKDEIGGSSLSVSSRKIIID